MLFVSIPTPSAHAAEGMLGELGPALFKKANSDSGMNVRSIQPSGEVLDDNDRELIKEAALGAMMQIELSKVAAAMASSEDVRMIANGELDEQAVVIVKLKEIAEAGGASLPTAPDEETIRLAGDLRREAGPGLDKMYLKKSGVEGHERLKSTMGKLREDAQDPALRALASAALPLIHTHLRMAGIEASGMN